MKKIIKITFVIFFLATINAVQAVIEPPFKNILVVKNPIEYKDIRFQDYDGNTLDLKDHNSEIYMLNFWATWCLPCKEEMPYLDELQSVDGINIYPINIEKNNKFKTEVFFKNLEIKNLSIYFDIENNLVNLFRLRGIPTTIILDKNRRELARIIGVVDLTDKKFTKWINSLQN